MQSSRPRLLQLDRTPSDTFACPSEGCTVRRADMTPAAKLMRRARRVEASLLSRPFVVSTRSGQSLTDYRVIPKYQDNQAAECAAQRRARKRVRAGDGCWEGDEREADSVSSLRVGPGGRLIPPSTSTRPLSRQMLSSPEIYIYLRASLYTSIPYRVLRALVKRSEVSSVSVGVIGVSEGDPSVLLTRATQPRARQSHATNLQSTPATTPPGRPLRGCFLPLDLAGRAGVESGASSATPLAHPSKQGRGGQVPSPPSAPAPKTLASVLVSGTHVSPTVSPSCNLSSHPPPIKSSRYTSDPKAVESWIGSRKT